MGKNKVLLDISTEFFELEIRGEEPSLNNLLNLKATKQIQKNNHKIELFYQENYPIVKIRSDIRVPLKKVQILKKGDEEYLPLFFENINYQFILKTKDNSEYSIRVTGSDSYKEVNDLIINNVRTGKLNFRENVGIANLDILKNRKVLLNIEFSVFSLKLDFLTDRLIMLNDLQAVNTSIVLSLFKSTSSNYRISKAQSNSQIEWLNNFIKTIDQLTSTLKRIESKAHNNLERKIIDYPINKIRNIDSNINDFLIKNGKDELKKKKYLQLMASEITYKSAELAYIKFLTENIQKKMKILLNRIETSQGGFYKRIKQEKEFLVLKRKNTLYKKQLKKPFWNSISPISALKNRTKFNFQKEFLIYEKNIKLLNRVIEIENSGSNSISVLSMDKLYESWLYLKIIDIISSILEIEDYVMIGYYEDFFRRYLAVGASNKINLGELIIYNNKEYNKNTKRFYSPTIPQIPDFTIELTDIEKLIIFDSKYKLQLRAKINDKWVDLNNIDLISLDKDIIQELFIARKDEDINTMHRYRDAIRKRNIDTHESDSAIEHAIILYPYKPKSLESDYYIREVKNIYDHGLGSIPVSPGLKDMSWREEIDKDKLVPEEDNIEQIRFLAKIIKDAILIKHTNLISD